MKTFLSKETVILAVLSVLSFIAALLFEKGYADSFGYDHSFIEIDIKATVISLACIVVAFIPLFIYLYVIFDLLAKWTKESRLLGMQIAFPIPMLILLYILGFQSKIAVFGLIISLLFAFFTLSKVLWKSRKLGWKDALSNVAISNGLRDFVGPNPKAENKTSTLSDDIVNFFKILIFFIIIGFMIRGVGVGVAYSKSEYQTFILDGEEVAIIASYGEIIIVGGITEDQFDRRISIIPKNSDKIKNITKAYFKEFITPSPYILN